MNSLYFIITSFIIIIIPGTGVIYTISTGITQGRKSSFYAATGCTLGIIPHLCLSIFLSSFLYKMSTTTFSILKIIGAVYLIYLGICLLISKPVLDLPDKSYEKRPFRILRSAILINLLNPKLSLFFFAFLPQYINETNDSYLLQSCLYGFSFMLLTWFVFIAYGIFASKLKIHINKSIKKQLLLQRLFGLIFIIFAIQLIL